MYSTMAFSLLDTPAELRREPAFLLYTTDFSRIQRFIYTVHTEGALRSLRSRSFFLELLMDCLLYTSPSPRDRQKSRMPSSA